MSLRKVAREFPWRRCIRRPIHVGQVWLQDPVMDYSAPAELNTAPKITTAGDLVRVMSDKPIPQNPSNLLPLASAQIANVSPIQEPTVRLPRIFAAAPVPVGYNSRAYSQAKTGAAENRDPTPEELDELFRLMSFDSPAGELRMEAHAIWKEMRSRKIIPTGKGYWALLKVLPR